MNTKPALVLAALAAAASPVRAELDAHPHQTPLTEAPTAAQIAVPRFQTSLGWLDEIRVEVKLKASATVGYENLSNSPGIFTAQLAAVAEVDGPDGSNIAVLSPLGTVQRHMQPYDGAADLGGTSGELIRNIELSSTQSWRSSGDPQWTTQTGGRPLQLALAVNELVDLFGTTEVVTIHQMLAQVDVDVTYEYTPWDEVEDGVAFNDRAPRASAREPRLEAVNDRRRALRVERDLANVA